MSNELTLTSGETIKPEMGLAFARGASSLLGAIIQRLQVSLMALQRAKVSQTRLAQLIQMMGLIGAAKAIADQAIIHFQNDLQTKAVAHAHGSGTDANYLG